MKLNKAIYYTAYITIHSFMGCSGHLCAEGEGGGRGGTKYSILTCNFMSFHLFQEMLFHAISCHIMSCHIWHGMCHVMLSCIMSYFLPCVICDMPYHVMSYFMSYHIISCPRYHVISYYIMSWVSCHGILWHMPCVMLHVMSYIMLAMCHTCVTNYVWHVMYHLSCIISYHASYYI